jgi:hypothetical protein
LETLEFFPPLHPLPDFGVVDDGETVYAWSDAHPKHSVFIDHR